MVIAPPSADRVRRALEAASGGRAVGRLARIRRGAQSANYAGVWADGGRFALKLVPFARAKQYRRLVEHLGKGAPGPAVRETSPRLRFDVGEFHALVLDWCGGDVVGFERLAAPADARALAADYGRFSAGIQGMAELYPTYDYPALLATVAASPLRRALPDGLAADDFAVLREGMRVIHGDFQPDNLRFADGRLSGVLDLEEFRLGSPAEDFARYVCNSADRLPWHAFRRRRRLLAGVRGLVAAARLAPRAWRAAVLGQLVEKLAKNVRLGRTSPLRAANLKWRCRIYRSLAAAGAAPAGEESRNG